MARPDRLEAMAWRCRAVIGWWCGYFGQPRFSSDGPYPALKYHGPLRYTCQREFALKHIKDDDMVELVHLLYDVVPGILTEHGKTKNP